MKLARSLLFLAVIGWPVLLSAAGNDDRHDAVIRDVMDSAGIPGLQSVIIRNGRILQAKSYGYAVLEEPGPRRAMGNDAVLFSASVVKILVAITVLQQVEAGKLQLDDDINASVPFSVRNPAWPDVPITWRLLLTHTSSMNTEPDERENLTDVFGSDPKSTLNDYIENSFSPAGKHFWKECFRPARPGSERIYSNDAFDLMGYVLQRILKEPLDTYVARRILKPLHMDASSYWLKGTEATPYAVGYMSERTPQGFKYTPIKAYRDHLPAGGRPFDHQMTCPNYVSGCMHTTALDLSRLMLMFLKGGTLDGVKVLSPASVELMTTPIGLRSLDGWSQGLSMNGPEDFRGRQAWGHDGEERGAANAFYFNRKTGVGVILLANAMDPDFTLTYVVDNLSMELLMLFE